MAPIKYTGEREEFDVSILQKKRLMKRKIVLAEQSNLFMNVLQQCLPCFDNVAREGSIHMAGTKNEQFEVPMHFCNEYEIVIFVPQEVPRKGN